MNRFTRVLLIAGLTLTGIYTFAQNAAPANQGVAKTPPATTSANASLPTEATVNAFLKQMFGWNTDLTWKIEAIKPSEAAGISEVTVAFNTPKGQQLTRIYVTPDQSYAFNGELVPFGADPSRPRVRSFRT